MICDSSNLTRHRLQADVILGYKGAVHKVCHAIFDDFLPPSPVTNCHKSWIPLKVNKQISRRMETGLNNYKSILRTILY